MSRRLAILGGLVTLVATACNVSGADEADVASEALARRAAAPTLRPGDVVELSVANGIAGGTITAGSVDEKYVVIVASTTFDTTGRELPWSIATGSAPTSASARIVDDCSLSATAWKAVPPPTESVPTGTAVAVGATKTLRAQTPSGIENIQVKAVAVGARAVVWADVTPAHPAVLDPAFVTQFLGDFESTILPRSEKVFGVESDVDGDGHVGLVFTPLTHQTAVAFFTQCDITNWKDCGGSNHGDLVWLTPPNAIEPPYNTPAAIKEILTHELSHLIHFNRKVVRNQLSEWADSGYMAEGIGGFAQDAIGPQAGNLYVALAGLTGFADFSLGNTLADNAPYDKERDGVLRGGSYLFVRWLYDRAGGDIVTPTGAIEGRGGPALLRALLDARRSVAAALPTAVKRPIEDLGVDFYTTLAMSNQDEVGGATPTNRCFAYLPTQVDPITGKQRGANLFARFHGMRMPGVATTDATTGKVRTGGAAFVTLAPGASGQFALTVNVDSSAAPRVRVGRLR